MHRWSWAMAVLMVGLISLPGCAAGLKGLWNGSGEVGYGLFFQFSLNTRDMDAPVAEFHYDKGTRATLAVCDLSEEDGAIEFKMDPDARAGTCETMVLPFRFIGRMGVHVITGRILDGENKAVGRFRAFRTET